MQSNLVSQTTESAEAVSAGLPHGAAEPAAPASAFASAAVQPDDSLLLQVRFFPDTRVWEIAECPEHLDKQEWFNLLCARVGANFQTRAGGRGYFRVTRAQLEALKARHPN